MIKSLNKLFNFFGRRIASVLLISLLLLTPVLTSLPSFHLEEFLGIEYSWRLDVIQHGSYYFVLTFLFFMLYQQRRLAGLVSILGLSFILELIQFWIPERSFSMLDIVSNCAGIAFAYAGAFLLGRYQLKRRYVVVREPIIDKTT